MLRKCFSTRPHKQVFLPCTRHNNNKHLYSTTTISNNNNNIQQQQQIENVQNTTTTTTAPIAANKRVFKARKQLFELTDAAASRIKTLLSNKEQVVGLSLGVRKRGCSGMSYTMDYATAPIANAITLQEKGVTVFIDPKAEFYLVGTVMDYVDKETSAEFVFNNPNAKNKCGCGESFHV